MKTYHILSMAILLVITLVLVVFWQYLRFSRPSLTLENQVSQLSVEFTQPKELLHTLQQRSVIHNKTNLQVTLRHISEIPEPEYIQSDTNNEWILATKVNQESDVNQQLIIGVSDFVLNQDDISTWLNSAFWGGAQIMARRNTGNLALELTYLPVFNATPKE